MSSRSAHDSSPHASSHSRALENCGALPHPDPSRASRVAPDAPARASRSRAFVTAACIAFALTATPAFAHKGSDAYWTIRADGPRVTGRLDVALRDLDLAVALDTNADGNITWNEVRAQQPNICTALTTALSLEQNKSRCPLTCGALRIVDHSDGSYAALDLDATCPAPVTELTASYALLFDADAQHRGLLSVAGAGETHWDAFTTNARTRTVSFSPVSASSQTGLAFAQGVHHIAIGWDHLCFLFALLLPSVLKRTEKTWAPRDAFKPTLLDVTKVVTAFTLAHSITLGLAAFEVVHPNAHWVEVSIAVSVALAAFNNLVPFVPETRWSLAFSLGLMHGFGFVQAIADLGAAGPSMWLSVLGFNLGVEAGQLCIVALFVPVAWLLRSRTAYLKVILPLGSAVILGVALFWTSQRI
ncbi:MAG: HupE/UreJ family protein [Archangium sp.]|nr:HupE/UreJ family protein [Archangium sp.]